MATRATQGGASASPTLPLDVLLATIPSLPRPVLSRLVARMIDHMDELDGDPDLEAEEDGERSEDTFEPWMLKDGDHPLFDLYSTLPVYGADQTQGPLNEAAAHRAHMRRMLRA